MISLDCSVKHNEWGKIGSDSFVASILKRQNHEIDETRPYTELWMGTHKSGPSRINGLCPAFDDKPLSSLLDAWPEFVGNIDIWHKYGHNLPILFKAVSIERPVPLQVHVNHPSSTSGLDFRPTSKMTIALTSIHVLCGFRPDKQIVDFMKKFKPLREIIGEDLCREYMESSEDEEKRRESLKKCFQASITAPKEIVAQKKIDLIASTKDDQSLAMLTWMAERNLDDNGLLAFFFLNHLQLQPEEAIVIAANQPHIYLVGNFLEIMNISDKVIKVGNDAKPDDMEKFYEYLTYRPTQTDDLLVKPVARDEFTKKYSSVSGEFTVDMSLVDQPQSGQYTAKATNSGSILLYLGPSETVVNDNYKLKPGHIYFTPPSIPLKFTHMRGQFKMFRASIRD